LLYLDTSFVAPLVMPEESSDAVEAFLRDGDDELATSQWTRVELARLVSRRMRMGEFNEAQAKAIRKTFEQLLVQSFVLLSPERRGFRHSRAVSGSRGYGASCRRRATSRRSHQPRSEEGLHARPGLTEGRGAA
jgi:hypothetical protein